MCRITNVGSQHPESDWTADRARSSTTRRTCRAARARTVCVVFLVSLGVDVSPSPASFPVLPGAGRREGPARGGRQAQAGALFVDGSIDSRIDFVHYNGTTGELLLPEITGAGGALFDYDRDGDLDLYVVQGAVLDPGRGEGAVPWTAPAPPKGRLYRNDLGTGGTGRLRFTDVTDRSGLVAVGYGMGAATGDVDNDGWIDLYVTSLGSNQIFHNNGDGSFSDVTAEAGADDPRWSASATFFDYDQDGWLDLFVANYVNFAIEMKRRCYSRGSAFDYCGPDAYDAVPDRLFHNDGDGTFSDVSVPSGITRAFWAGLGVVATDLTGDGWTDLYVANDGDSNQAWINERGSGVFRDEALLAGLALNRAGQAEAGMGVDAGDFDGDGDEDLFVTHLEGESNTLYANLGDGLFEDRTIGAGLHRPSLRFTGFGTHFVGYDNDGWLDLLVLNGAVRLPGNRVREGEPYPLKQRNQLFRNTGRARFVDVTDSAGPAFEALEVSRGAAFGDLDNDDDTDVMVFNSSGPVQVLLNEVGGRQHWLGVRVLDDRHDRDAVQVRVELVGPAGRSLWRRVRTDGSYCAASDARVLFGLAGDGSPRTIRVHWPGGRVREFRDLSVDRYWVLEWDQTPLNP